ncbi:MAG: hypothetical protein ACI959_001193 [Limisphaerales bacterium]|jgi:hypothetical protein
MNTLNKFAVTILAVAFSSISVMGQGAWLVDPGDEQIYTNPAAADVKVGIGITEPLHTLDVNGDAIIRDNVGINTSVSPTQELYVRGQMYMGSTGFVTPTQEDKISLHLVRIDETDMVGFGFETELFFNSSA